MLLRQLQFSFPIRLLVLHIRSHLVLVFLWAFLGVLVTGQAGRFFGIHYLMLTPEYCGEVGFWSSFLTGAAFGAFFMIWNLTTYLLCADRFPFLATLSAPFTKFSLNNSLLPILFLCAYMSAAIWFQSHDEMTQWSDIVVNVGSFILGAVFFIVGLAIYLHFTNKDMAAFLRHGQFVPRPGGRLLAPGQRIPSIGEIKAGTTRWRVDTYLTERCHVRLVRSVAHYDSYWLNKVFRQNHTNAIIVQGVALLLMMVHGWLMEVSWAKLPTSVSVFMLFSMVMAFFGAITFWFRQWSTFVFIALIVLINFITSKGFFVYQNHAYGLDYDATLQPQYNYKLLETFSADSILEVDKKQTISVLNRWKDKQITGSEKPKLALICVSGGGHKAGLWVVRVMQAMDSLTQGRLLHQTALITGASGGMLGAAYMREAMLLEHTNGSVRIQDPSLFSDLGRDLLNPITSSLVSNDLIFPFRKYHYAGHKYQIDRGYYFEKQLNENVRNRFNRKVADYRTAEESAIIPMLVLSPYIINDSRRMLISPLGMSYLTRPLKPKNDGLGAEIDGVEWRRLFEHQQGDSLLLRSALRMNCTFPYILPNTWLPTQPALEIMDAGVRDNFGLGLGTRFLHVFKDWIKENTSGVVVVQIRCWDKIDYIEPASEKGFVGSLLTPVVAAGKIAILQDYEQDDALSFLADILGPDQLEVVRFIYKPVQRKRQASLSFHLSKREQVDVFEAFNLPDNMAASERLNTILTGRK
ncbi:MAG: hypothetical protein RIR11_931 [Bacteroidota bacterium]|jgi:hypothetical protein